MASRLRGGPPMRNDRVDISRLPRITRMRMRTFLLLVGLISTQLGCAMPRMAVNTEHLGSTPIDKVVRSLWMNGQSWLQQHFTQEYRKFEPTLSPREKAGAYGFICAPAPAKFCEYSGFIIGKMEGVPTENRAAQRPFVVTIKLDLLDLDDQNSIITRKIHSRD
jgi:hypothetical protein